MTRVGNSADRSVERVADVWRRKTVEREESHREREMEKKEAKSRSRKGRGRRWQKKKRGWAGTPPLYRS